jgi:hypothetical protein
VRHPAPALRGGVTRPRRPVGDLAAASAAPGIYYYTSEISNNSYILNQFVSNFTKAQEFCTDNGGHLAAFASLEEQQEVEGYYIEMGYLLPTYHKSYYIGAWRSVPALVGSSREKVVQAALPIRDPP